jgi:hypothetical protein
VIEEIKESGTGRMPPKKNNNGATLRIEIGKRIPHFENHGTA